MLELTVIILGLICWGFYAYQTRDRDEYYLVNWYFTFALIFMATSGSGIYAIILDGFAVMAVYYYRHPPYMLAYNILAALIICAMSVTLCAFTVNTLTNGLSVGLQSIYVDFMSIMKLLELLALGMLINARGIDRLLNRFNDAYVHSRTDKVVR